MNHVQFSDPSNKSAGADSVALLLDKDGLLLFRRFLLLGLGTVLVSLVYNKVGEVNDYLLRAFLVRFDSQQCVLQGGIDRHWS